MILIDAKGSFELKSNQTYKLTKKNSNLFYYLCKLKHIFF